MVIFQSYPNGDRLTPLLMAIRNYNIDVVKILLELGADPNLKGTWDEVRTSPMRMAKALWLDDIVEMIKDYVKEGDEEEEEEDPVTRTQVQFLRYLKWKEGKSFSYNVRSAFVKDV